MKAQRRPPAAVDPRQNTRLAYSTGGEIEPAKRAAAAPPPSAKGGVRLRLERRASGRLVTLVSGLPAGADELAQWGRELRNACGTGGTVKDGVVELQGDQRETVEAHLHARGLASKRAGG